MTLFDKIMLIIILLFGVGASFVVPYFEGKIDTDTYYISARCAYCSGAETQIINLEKSANSLAPNFVTRRAQLFGEAEAMRINIKAHGCNTSQGKRW